jgi:23S rRNA pseudouridine1911/1915/1917 synthase
MAGQDWTVPASDDGARLDKFLAHPERLVSRAKAFAAIDRGKVYVNDATVTAPATRLTRGDVVRVWIDKPGSAKRPIRPGMRGDLDMVYEDDVLIVINKPAGVLSVPLERKREVPSVYDQVQDYLRPSGRRRPHVVHRIDQDTSGLVAFAKDLASQERLKAQFKRREPERVYWAVVYGHPDPPSGTWRDRLVWDAKALIQKETHPKDPQGTDAISLYATMETFAAASLIEVRLETGRRNQIRIQARLRGHTLVGEERYTYGPETLRPIAFVRHALHARRLAFRHPLDDRLLTFEAEPPADFADLLTRLRRRSASG